MRLCTHVVDGVCRREPACAAMHACRRRSLPEGTRLCGYARMNTSCDATGFTLCTDVPMLGSRGVQPPPDPEGVRGCGRMLRRLNGTTW